MARVFNPETGYYLGESDCDPWGWGGPAAGAVGDFFVVDKGLHAVGACAEFRLVHDHAVAIAGVAADAPRVFAHRTEGDWLARRVIELDLNGPSVAGPAAHDADTTLHGAIRWYLGVGARWVVVAQYFQP